MPRRPDRDAVVGIQTKEVGDGVRPPPGSPTDESILAHIGEHLEDEREIVDSYRGLAESSADDAVKYLMNLIVADEERHHRVLLEMENTIRSGIEFREISPSVPTLGDEQDVSDLLELSRQFLAVEKSDARSLRRLRHEARAARPTSLLPLLVELMEKDTDKHIRILRFIVSHAKRQS